MVEFITTALFFLGMFIVALVRVHRKHQAVEQKLRERDEEIRQKLRPPDNVVPITKKLALDIIDLEIERKINQ